MNRSDWAELFLELITRMILAYAAKHSTDQAQDLLSRASQSVAELDAKLMNTKAQAQAFSPQLKGHFSLPPGFAEANQPELLPVADVTYPVTQLGMSLIGANSKWRSDASPLQK